MYERHKNGRFRARASFDITERRIVAMNAICEKMDVSFQKLCLLALDRLINDFTKNGKVKIPKDMPEKTN